MCVTVIHFVASMLATYMASWWIDVCVYIYVFACTLSNLWFVYALLYASIKIYRPDI